MTWGYWKPEPPGSISPEMLKQSPIDKVLRRQDEPLKMLRKWREKIVNGQPMPMSLRSHEVGTGADRAALKPKYTPWDIDAADSREVGKEGLTKQQTRDPATVSHEISGPAQLRLSVKMASSRLRFPATVSKNGNREQMI